MELRDGYGSERVRSVRVRGRGGEADSQGQLGCEEAMGMRRRRLVVIMPVKDDFEVSRVAAGFMSVGEQQVRGGQPALNEWHQEPQDRERYQEWTGLPH